MNDLSQAFLVSFQNSAVALAALGSGLLLLVGLLTGVWKYLAIMNSEKSRAPYYVDIAHRASLMYSFSALVLAVLAGLSVWPPIHNFWAVAANLIYFIAAISTYVIHGALRDTSNQLARPHRLGKATLPNILISGFMWSLIVAEVGGTVVLLSGATVRLWPVIAQVWS
ncbi:hypothetical protein [Aquirhabdus parva]|uniref:DUF350 domain-containing protein n=1 Tax=Aquirhabdus parva TaxID=2283318 RepID=A0A345P4N6_9GAMM|nr:hypothetical protein [Aquirhabdus parva]AXI02245.1 hypothetical protein HYN46_04960 [Aquirhabdus parva]